MIPTFGKTAGVVLAVLSVMPVVGCRNSTDSDDRAAAADTEPRFPFRNIQTATAYVGDDACTSCHAEAARAYQTSAMASSFHRWTPDVRVETALDVPILHEPTGFYYSVVDDGGELYQEEYLVGPAGQRLHRLRRRIDYVMGSGAVARTYFTEENGRLFQLPLTWYRQGGWDWSPGYEFNNARFDRLMPDRCLACHGSYPERIPFLEGKYANLPPGIGCERCHGPGALHVEERSAGLEADTIYDATIVNPTHLPFERRLDVCQQCHVHTPVTVLRAGRDAFSYQPSERLSDHAAFFKTTGDIDIVSHADRLRQSACFVATRTTDAPLECATCHNPHAPAPDVAAQNQPCTSCHPAAALAPRLARSDSRSEHSATANCVSCHMPSVKERTVPHGSFTDHWIRVVTAASAPARARRTSDDPIEPYFERDGSGPEAKIYQGMGKIVYAALAPDVRALVDGAETLSEAIGDENASGEFQFLLGVAYQQLGRTDAAIAALERSVRADSAHPERLHALAQAYERAGRDPATIDRLYRKVFALQPALAWIRADYADFLYAHGNLEEAEAAYVAALAERPSLDVAQFNLGTLLTAQGRLDEASEAFQQAVRLNPSLAEALTPLLQMRTSRDAVTGVRFLESPLVTLPVRSRGPNAVQLTIDPRRPGDEVAFINVPRGATVWILEPQGAPVRVLPDRQALTVRWDLSTEAGRRIGGGLYRVRVAGEDASGASIPPQQFYIGVVRQATR